MQIPTNWKILKEMGKPDHFNCLLRNLCAGKEATVELDMEQQTGSKLGKKYVKAIYCHPAYLTYMHNDKGIVYKTEGKQAGPGNIQNKLLLYFKRNVFLGFRLEPLRIREFCPCDQK